MVIEVIEREPLRYAYIRHQGAYPEIGGTFGRLVEIARSAGLLEGAFFVGVYYDDPSRTPPETLRSDAGVTLSADAAIPDGLEEGVLIGGRYAKGVNLGSYSTMGESWMATFDAIHRQDLHPKDAPTFEVYLGDMDTTPEDELITELYVPVE